MEISGRTINSVLAVILGILCFCIAIKEIRYKRFERFEWNVAVNIDEGQLIQVYHCHFEGSMYDIDEDRIMNSVDSDCEHPNYSESNSQNSLYPDHCSLKWFSYTENKFYEADLSLPKDSIKRVAKRFRKEIQADYTSRGYSDREQEICVTFNAELKKNGKFEIWISSYELGAGEPEKIGDYQAHEIQEDWNTFKPDSKLNRNEWVQLVCNQYDWNVIVDLPEQCEPLGLNITTFRGTRGAFEKDDDDEEKTEPAPVIKPIPYDISFYWKNEKGEQDNVAVYFDEKEIYDCFSTLYKSGKSGKTNIIIKITETGRDYKDSIKVSLKKENIEMEMHEVRIY